MINVTFGDDLDLHKMPKGTRIVAFISFDRLVNDYLQKDHNGEIKSINIINHGIELEF